ncbi:MAG: M28 family peptidase, partial [Acidimicrobiia bacterium]|nr:M28 family peptidase [Acidimicrobiia bacterium]
MKTALLLIVLCCVACATGGQPTQQQTTVTTSTTVPSITTATTAPVVESTTTSVPSVVDRIVLDRTEAATTARMQADVAYLNDIGPREAGTDAEAETARWLTDSLRARGLAVTVEAVPLPNGRESTNVIARIGRGPRAVVVGAHMDTIRDSPGIDDNGSGVVILRELARRLSETPPDVTVTLVFFGAEEVLEGYPRDAHHHGSRQMALRLASEGALPDAMISVDMVGVG